MPAVIHTTRHLSVQVQHARRVRQCGLGGHDMRRSHFPNDPPIHEHLLPEQHANAGDPYRRLGFSHRHQSGRFVGK